MVQSIDRSSGRWIDVVLVYYRLTLQVYQIELVQTSNYDNSLTSKDLLRVLINDFPLMLLAIFRPPSFRRATCTGTRASRSRSKRTSTVYTSNYTEHWTRLRCERPMVIRKQNTIQNLTLNDALSLYSCGRTRYISLR